MRLNRVLSFPTIALKVGVVSVDLLRSAYAVSEARGVSLESVLTRGEFMDPELVSFVRDVQSRARVTCDRCGGRTDLRPTSREFVCRCSRLGQVA